MKAILEFALPEDDSEFRAAYNGNSALVLLAALDEWLRRKVKYEAIPEEAKEVYAEVRQWVASEVEARRLPVWD